MIQFWGNQKEIASFLRQPLFSYKNPPLRKEGLMARSYLVDWLKGIVIIVSYCTLQDVPFNVKLNGLLLVPLKLMLKPKVIEPPLAGIEAFQPASLTVTEVPLCV